MATKRDPSTIDMFTGEVDPPVIPKSKALVARAKKAVEQPTPSVPTVPLPPDPVPLVPKLEPAPAAVEAVAPPAHPQAADPDITLFPHAYLLVLGLAWAAIGVVIADNLYDAGITGSVVKHRAHITTKLDQYRLATVRGVAAAIIAFFTICCGLHIAVRNTALPPVRYTISAGFLLSALVLIVVTYICEADYMGIGIPDILRRLQNIWKIKWS
jgi:hypothetical protein